MFSIQSGITYIVCGAFSHILGKGLLCKLSYAKSKRIVLWDSFMQKKIETWKVWRTPNKDIMYSSHLKTMQHVQLQRQSVNTE